MNNQTNQKKILRIRQGEYLLAVEPKGVVTTHDKDRAMDISMWSLDQLGHMVKNLSRVGYKKAQVETVELEANDPTLKADVKIRELLEREDEYDSKELQEKSRKLKELVGYSSEGKKKKK